MSDGSSLQPHKVKLNDGIPFVSLRVRRFMINLPNLTEHNYDDLRPIKVNI